MSKKNNLAAIKHKKKYLWGLDIFDETKLIRGQINRSLFKIELREHIKSHTLHQTTKKMIKKKVKN
jgi:uncharacterized protein YaaW (UPF0174 family)